MVGKASEVGRVILRKVVVDSHRASSLMIAAAPFEDRIVPGDL